MLNLLDLFKKSVKTSIEDKTLPSSISRFNVGQRIKDLADLTMRVPLLQDVPGVFYPLGFKGRDTAFNEYIAIVDNVNGDYTDSAKWKPSGGGGTFSPFKTTITCDGVVASYTITHGKNNYAPSVSVWFLDTGNSIWQPLDVTQGITGSTSDPNVIYFNPMVYMGNNNGFIYKLTIPA